MNKNQKNVALTEDDSAVIIIDQTQLPNKVDLLRLETIEDVYNAIFYLKVRGAPAIGICAALSMFMLANKIKADTREEFIREFKKIGEKLNASRPTAVNLSWAIKRMYKATERNVETDIREILIDLKQEALAIQQEDINMCKKIAENGLSLIKEGDGILTHCNAGPLATSSYGTALGPMLLGKERGMGFKVFADETRPLLQGARLTTYELNNAGIDVTLICDNMASIVMKNGWINACIVGCDRVAKNGDTANKIGTSGVAILAKHYNIPFYVCGPSSTIDLDCKTGEDIEIELRHPDEISEKFYTQRMAPKGINIYNPAFDVTDNSLITAIITERGIFTAPYEISLDALR